MYKISFLEKIPHYIFIIVSVFVLTLVNILLPFFTQQIYYWILFLILGIIIVQSSIKYLNPFALLFICCTGLSLVFNDPPEFFHAEMRWVGWLLVFILFGPVLRNRVFHHFRINSFKWVLRICEIVGVGSFIWYLIGLPNFGRGVFTGLTYHSMVLGPLAAIGCISILHRIIYDKCKYKALNYCFLLFSLASMLLASSRTAVIAVLAVSVFCLFVRYKGKLILLLGGVGILFLLGSSFLGFSNRFTDGLVQKGEKDSRTELWGERITEFKSSPICGIGFATASSTRSDQDEEGGLEPGSSWLAILAMTGIIGFISFIGLLFSIYFNLIVKVLKKSNEQISIIVGVSGFFFISFIAEGYVFASGSALGMVFWLTLGTSWDLSLFHANKKINHPYKYLQKRMFMNLLQTKDDVRS